MIITQEQLDALETVIETASKTLELAEDKHKEKPTKTTEEKVVAAEAAVKKAQAEFETSKLVFNAVQEATKAAEKEKEKAVQEAVNRTREELKTAGAPIVLQESGATYLKILDELVALPKGKRPEFITLETKGILNLITVNFNCLESVDEKGKVKARQDGLGNQGHQGHRCDRFDVPPTRKVKISGEYLKMMGEDWSYREYIKRGELVVKPVE